MLRALTDSAVDFDAVADLCEMSARKDAALAALAGGGDLTIAACYPRAVKWLFSAAGAPLSEDVRILNMRAQTAAEVASGMLGAPTLARSRAHERHAPGAARWSCCTKGSGPHRSSPTRGSRSHGRCSRRAIA